MPMTASDYEGTYYVKVAQETVGDLARGDQIDITTDGVDETTAYVTITTAEGVLDGSPFTFILDHQFGCLRGDTLPIPGHVMLISRYEEQTQTGTYKALYGSIIKKDPDSVGAWGADGDPPDDPVAEPAAD